LRVGKHLSKMSSVPTQREIRLNETRAIVLLNAFLGLLMQAAENAIPRTSRMFERMLPTSDV
jgi:hypothetical protein